MSPLRAADVKFYFDADVRGLGKIIGGLRPDSTYPGDPGATIHRRTRPPCPIPSTDVKDVEWIPLVAARGWLIITRDRRIQQHTRERHAVRDHGARMVNLGSADAFTVWANSNCSSDGGATSSG